MQLDQLDIKKVSFRYPRRANLFTLKIDFFQLKRGEIVFLHGNSGCGKTTLMNLLSGVINSDISKKCRSVFKTISFVMHESTLLPWLSVLDNLKVEEKLRGISADQSRFELLCNRMLLNSDSLAKMPGELSLGMRQRIEIAKALAFRPDLIFIDEGLSGIDNKSKKIVAETLWKNVEQESITIIGTAHHVSDLLMLAQRVYLFDNGRLTEVIRINEPVAKRLAMSIKELMEIEGAQELMYR